MKRKPAAWLLWRSPQSYHLVSEGELAETKRWLKAEDGRTPRPEPLYRESPTAKEEQAVVRAAVKWAQTGDWRELEPLGDAVDRLLAARKAKR